MGNDAKFISLNPFLIGGFDQVHGSKIAIAGHLKEDFCLTVLTSTP